MKSFASVQDVFFGAETIVHIKRGSAVPEPAEIAEALAVLEIACDGVRRDDSLVF